MRMVSQLTFMASHAPVLKGQLVLPSPVPVLKEEVLVTLPVMILKNLSAKTTKINHRKYLQYSCI